MVYDQQLFYCVLVFCLIAGFVGGIINCSNNQSVSKNQKHNFLDFLLNGSDE
jgi:hypothetical protein